MLHKDFKIEFIIINSICVQNTKAGTFTQAYTVLYLFHIWGMHVK